MQLVTTAEVKQHLRIDDNSEDTLIAQYILAAQDDAETITHRPLYSETDPDAITDDPAKLPAAVKQFILITAGDYYRNRENRGEKQFSSPEELQQEIFRNARQTRELLLS